MNIPPRGPFTFPSPYNTTGIKVSNETDREILPRTYSYWQNINAHKDQSSFLVFAGIAGKGPCLWTISKSNYAVEFLGPIFPAGHFLSSSTAEGWYFDSFYPDILFCNDDEHLYRYHLTTQYLQTIIDITPFRWMGRFALRQWHSSENYIHSASVLQVVESGSWPKIGTIVYNENSTQPWSWFPAVGNLDESQIDKSGAWLLIKENDDNRIINLKTGEQRIVLDQDGAAGHSDNGYGYSIGADNFQQYATWKRRMFDSNKELIVLETSWTAQVLHVSHCNALNSELNSQWVLGSGQLKDLIKIPLDGSFNTRPIAPKMTIGESYDLYPKASLDPYGTWAFWTAFLNGRFDIFLAQVW